MAPNVQQNKQTQTHQRRVTQTNATSRAHLLRDSHQWGKKTQKMKYPTKEKKTKKQIQYIRRFTGGTMCRSDTCFVVPEVSDARKGAEPVSRAPSRAAPGGGRAHIRSQLIK